MAIPCEECMGTGVTGRVNTARGRFESVRCDACDGTGRVPGRHHQLAQGTGHGEDRLPPDFFAVDSAELRAWWEDELRRFVTARCDQLQRQGLKKAPQILSHPMARMAHRMLTTGKP